MSEMPLLNSAITMSEREQALLAGWQAPPSWNARAGREGTPPGLGKFLVKVGGRPGIPVQVVLTPRELRVNGTNRLWHD